MAYRLLLDEVLANEAAAEANATLISTEYNRASGAEQVLTDDVTANAASIVTNAGGVTTNGVNIATNVTGIATNVSSIASTNAVVAGNATDIAANETAITSEAATARGAESALGTRIDNILDAGDSLDQISELVAAYVGADSNLQTAMGTLITAEETRASGVEATLTSGVATNVSGIAGNVSDITSNSNSISSSASDIVELQEQMGFMQVDVSFVTSAGHALPSSPDNGQRAWLKNTSNADCALSVGSSHTLEASLGGHLPPYAAGMFVFRSSDSTWYVM